MNFETSEKNDSERNWISKEELDIDSPDPRLPLQ